MNTLKIQPCNLIILISQDIITDYTIIKKVLRNIIKIYLKKMKFFIEVYIIYINN